METLTATSLKVLLENHRDKERGFWCPTPKDASLISRPEIRSFGCGKLLNPRFSLSVSLYRKTIRPVSSAHALSSSDTENRLENEEIQSEAESKTVHVKFELRKGCSFGQQFLIVGDDPMFGLWDPSNAVPLNWSEGHVWKVELDMPCDKAIKYKFILKGGNAAISWQPGPDRMLQTWETRKTITVCEDWENAELQTIIEEDPTIDQLTESLDNSEMLIVTENLLQHDENEKRTIENGYSEPTEKLWAGKAVSVAENITEQNGKPEFDLNGISSAKIATNTISIGVNNFQKNGIPGNAENLTVSKDELNLDSGAEIPLLVPGLPPTARTEEAPVTEDKNMDADASLGSEKAEQFSVPEINLEEERATGLKIPKEESAMLLNDKQELHGKGCVEKSQLLGHKDQPEDHEMGNDVLENDIQWGRRTLQQFLMALGLL